MRHHRRPLRTFPSSPHATMQHRTYPTILGLTQQPRYNTFPAGTDDSDTDDSDVENALTLGHSDTDDHTVDRETAFFGAPSLPKFIVRLLPSDVHPIISTHVIPMVISNVASWACPPLCTSQDLLGTFSQIWGYCAKDNLNMMSRRVEINDVTYTLVRYSILLI